MDRIAENDSSEFGDYWIKFMHPHGPASNFSWPDKDDHVWVIQKNIYCMVNTPGFTSSSSRTYSLNDKDIKIYQSLLPTVASDS